MRRLYRRLTSERSQLILAIGCLQIVVLGIGWVLGYLTEPLLPPHR